MKDEELGTRRERKIAHEKVTENAPTGWLKRVILYTDLGRLIITYILLVKCIAYFRCSRETQLDLCSSSTVGGYGDF